ncbi:MAG: hypothetical protein LW832_02420 [Parachlamydia sp.]|jgi:hypothetical protein|nr:hypothetical protein [Parachlamydia sp.]
MQIPLWFHALAKSPETLQENFYAKLKGKELTSEFFFELLQLLGRGNLACVSWPAEMLENLKKEARQKDIRFLYLLQEARDKLIDGHSLSPRKFDKLYAISFTSRINVEELAINEMTSYLLSLSMPLHESIRLNCHRIKKINFSLAYYETKVIKAADKLFNWQNPSSFTLEEEQLLFRRAATKRGQKVRTLGHLFIRWAAQSQSINNFRFDKILCINSQQTAARTTLSFMQFLAVKTIHQSIFHKDCLLPQPDSCQELRDLFGRCFKSQQEAVYYIDYLNSSVLAKQFDFDQALHLLNELQTSQDLYPFLHSALHYYHCLSKYHLEDGKRKGLFKAIHSLGEEKNEYNRWIHEKSQRKPFPLDEFLNFIIQKKLSLQDTGRIVLKFAMSLPAKTPSLYLSCRQHIKLLQNIETKLGCHIPKRFISEILYFQSFRKKTQEIEELSNFKKNIEESYIDYIGLTKDSYQTLKGLTLRLLKNIDVDLTEGFFTRNNRLDFYLDHRSALVTYLSLAAYPLSPLIEFSPFIPLKAEKKFFEMNANLCELNPLHPGVPEGPQQLMNWTVDPKMNFPIFHVCLIDSLEKPQISAYFSLVLPLSLEEEWATPFFETLHYFIDRFGSPSLSEEDFEAVEKMNQHYDLPDRCLSQIGESADAFDSILDHSPLLELFWQKQSSFGTKNQEVKAALFNFVKELRILYKKSCYSLPNKKFSIKRHFDEISFFYLTSHSPALGEKLYEVFKQPNFTIEWEEFTIEKEEAIRIEGENTTGVFDKIKISNSTSRSPLIIKFPHFESVKQLIKIVQWQISLFKQQNY